MAQNKLKRASKKTAFSRSAIIIILIISLAIIAVSRQLQKSLTLTSLGANRDAGQESLDSSTDGTFSCQYIDLKMGPLKNAFGGDKCYASASFSCNGGPHDKESFTIQAPQGTGGCLIESKWKEKASDICGCSGNDRSQFNPLCHVRQIVTSTYNNNTPVCTIKSKTCSYEADIVCSDYQKHHIVSDTCLERDTNSGWKFQADVTCCKGFNDDGTYRDACREYPLSDYSSCQAYCQQRGFKCIFGGTRGFTCDDPKCKTP